MEKIEEDKYLIPLTQVQLAKVREGLDALEDELRELKDKFWLHKAVNAFPPSE